MLARTCDALLAVDIDETALAAARKRCAELPNLRFAQLQFPHQTPVGTFDLVVISEVAYYWSDRDLAAAIDFCARSGAETTIALVHYLPKVDDYVRDGDAVHEAFLDDARFTTVWQSRADRYRIDILRTLAPATAPLGAS